LIGKGELRRLSSAFAESGAFFSAHWKLILTIAYLAWAFAVVV
jgi:hypothetical protein